MTITRDHQSVTEPLLDVEDPLPLTIHEEGWVTLLAGQSNPFCQWHAGFCCYIEDDPERCPWCHTTWSTIIRSDDHSCERKSQWTADERDMRTEMARQMHAEASHSRDHGARSPMLSVETLNTVNGAQSRVAA